MVKCISADSTVSFRLMLFAPFISEVITGRIISTSKSYIRGQCHNLRLWQDGNIKSITVGIDFFRDIYITPALLPPNSI